MNEDEETAEAAVVLREVNKHEGKHVRVNDEPEVYTIRPDTLEVEKQERPKRASFTNSKHRLSPEQEADLIETTADIIRTCEQKVIIQKIDNAKLGFMLIRIAKSIEEYEICINHLISFFINGDEVTAKYFIDVCERLPPYGDYLSALGTVADTSMILRGVEGPVEKTCLLKFVTDIQKISYSGGISLKAFRAVNENINKYVWERKQMIEHFNMQVRNWLKIKNDIVGHLDTLRQRLFTLSTLLDFTESGETKIKPSTDTSGSPFEDSSFRPDLHSTLINYEDSSFRPNFHSSGVTFEDSSFRPNYHSTGVTFEDSSLRHNYHSTGVTPENFSFRPNYYSTGVTSEDSSFRPNYHSTGVTFEDCSFRPNYHSTDVTSEDSSFRHNYHSTGMTSEDSSFRHNYHSTGVTSEDSGFRHNYHSTGVTSVTSKTRLH